jgi:hypothetical protein
VVDRTALEMRHRCKPIGGSNPSLSAKNTDFIGVLRILDWKSRSDAIDRSLPDIRHRRLTNYKNQTEPKWFAKKARSGEEAQRRTR